MPDRIETFSRVREKMSAELESVLESALPLIANDIEAAAQKGSLSIHEQRQMYAAAATLRMERRGRISDSRAVFNERALRCLEVATQAASGKKALSLLEEDELEVQILAADFANYVRQEQSRACLGLAKRVEFLTHRQWSNDDLQPLGARTLGAAAGAAVRSLAMAPSAKREIKAIVLDRLKDALSRLIAETDRDLIAQGILSDWSPVLEREPDREPVREPVRNSDRELRADPTRVIEPMTEFEHMPLPAIWPARPAAIEPPMPPLPVEPMAPPDASPPVAAAIVAAPVIAVTQAPVVAAAATTAPAVFDTPFPELPALPELSDLPPIEPPPAAAHSRVLERPAPNKIESIDAFESETIEIEGLPDAVATEWGDEPPSASRPAAAAVEAEAIESISAPAGKRSRSVDMSELAAEVSRKLDRSPFAPSDAPTKLRVLPVLQPVLDIERDAVAFAHSIGAVPYSRESRREFFSNVRDRLREASASAAQVATVEVVGAMFDYVVDDRRLPEPAKPLFWRLQQPSVALSLLDPGYLSNEPRSLRRLIENFGAIATAYSDEFVKGGELHRRLETVVRAVEIVSSALQVRSAVISQHVDKEYNRAVRNVTQLVDRVVNERSSLESTPARQNRRDYRRRPDKQREIEVSEKLRLMLEDRVSKHQIPESAKEFILGVWLRHLRTAVLRDGEESTEFKLALEVVDDLLWSMDSTKATHSRGALAKRIPPLIRLLTSGLREIGAREDDHKAFFDELFLVHLRKMRRNTNGVDDTVALSDLAPLTSLPTLRDEIDSLQTLTATGTNPTKSEVPDAAKRATLTKSATITSAAPGGKPVTSNGGVEPARTAPAANPRAPAADPAAASGFELPKVVPTSLRASPSKTRQTISASNTPDVPRFVPAAATQPAPDPLPQSVRSSRAGNGEKTLTDSPRLLRTAAGRGQPNDDFSAGVLNRPSIQSNGEDHAPNSGHDGDDAVSVADDQGPEQRLLEVLHSLDLSDPPQSLDREDIAVDRLVATVGRGHWLTLIGQDGGVSIAKIAWVNSRRTVVLLVRHPDRRALSMRMDELRQRAEQGRAYLIARK